MLSLLIATNNPGKVHEFERLMKGICLELLTPALLGIELQVEENGASYLENALIKARAFSMQSGLWTLADDSGLEVEALEGLPGLHSARFVQKPGATDSDRRSWLLHLLDGKPKPWPAAFRCVIAVVGPGGRIESSEGVCRGEITPFERGTNGFGYDPVFLITELGKTMAELSMHEKNQISHRARAVKNILPFIHQLAEVNEGSDS